MKLVLIASHLLLSISGTSATPCQTESLLTTADCTARNGVMNGARCYFVTTGPLVTWNDAWGECAKLNGTLAQIHTADEFDMLTPLVNSPTVKIIVWYALSRDTNTDRTDSCDVMKDASFWYEGRYAKNAALSARATWFRYRVCDELDPTPGEFCYSWTTTTNTIGDRNCYSASTISARPLCHFNTQKQKYTKTAYCLQETVFETLANINSIQECADVCSQRIWCRSFNYRPDVVNCANHTCEFFSMSSLDSCPQCADKTAGSSDCIHYNYVS